MEITDFLDHAVDFGADAFIRGSLGACSGYIVAVIIGSDRLLMAKAFAIHTIAIFMFGRSVVYMHPDKLKLRDKVGLIFLGQSLGGVVFTLTLIKLELVTKIGAVVLGSLVVLQSVMENGALQRMGLI
jgi:hypothetical protein